MVPWSIETFSFAARSYFQFLFMTPKSVACFGKSSPFSITIFTGNVRIDHKKSPWNPSEFWVFSDTFQEKSFKFNLSFCWPVGLNYCSFYTFPFSVLKKKIFGEQPKNLDFSRKTKNHLILLIVALNDTASFWTKTRIFSFYPTRICWEKWQLIVLILRSNFGLLLFHIKCVSWTKIVAI